MNAQLIQFEDGVFKQLIIDLGYDTNEDGEIDQGEANEVETLSIPNNNINNIIGINNFKNLTGLSIHQKMDAIDLLELDRLGTVFISSNIDTIHIEECNSLGNIKVTGSNIELIEISNCKSLYSLDLEVPDVKKCVFRILRMDFFGRFNSSIIPSFHYYNCTFPISISLSSIGVWQYDELKFVSCSGPAFESLKVSSFTNKLIVHDCPNVKELKAEHTDRFVISSCDSLTILDFDQDFVDSIDLKDLVALETLFVHNLNEFLSVRDSDQLKYISISEKSGAPDIDLSDCPSLETLRIGITGLIGALNLKNGTRQNLNIVSVQRIWDLCMDEFEAEDFAEILSNAGTDLVVFTTLCKSTTSTDNLELNDFIRIAPNPSQDFFRVYSDLEFTDLTVINSQGQLIRNFIDANTKSVNLIGEKSGVYYLRFKTKKDTVIKKLIKI